MKNDPIGIVLQHEGGFVNQATDKGGPTKFGVTQRTYANYLGRPVTLQEVKDMDIETAREIYERNYYSGPRIHTLPEPVRTLVLDMAINHGPITAILMLQRLVNAAGFGPITVDGVIGPRTRNAVEAANTRMGKVLVNALVEDRIRLYNSIVVRDPSQSVYLNGWTKRAESFLIP